MKVAVYDLNGKESGKIDLPKVFSTPVRKDLIKRAFLSTMSKRRQLHGTDPLAGQRSSAHYHGRRRRERWSMMNREMARMSRLHGKIPGWQMYRARNVPQSVKGRAAHPPKTETIWVETMNKKERKLAIRSAIAATADKKLVEARGHIIKDIKDAKEFPIVVDNAAESLKKTSEVKALLTALGLKGELDRIADRKALGRKKSYRGRTYKRRTGPLIVVANDKGIYNAAKNISGVNINRIENLSVGRLAPGAVPGRLTIFTKGAIEKLAAEKLAIEKLK
jgi:large subunit ribosomal protein L4e